MKRLAALVMVWICVFCLIGCNATEESDSGDWDYPPMIMYNGTLYTAASFMGEKKDLAVVGKIESCIDFGVPTENNQANDPLLGCEIYAASSAPDYIFVLTHGRYSAYKAATGGA